MEGLVRHGNCFEIKIGEMNIPIYDEYLFITDNNETIVIDPLNVSDDLYETVVDKINHTERKTQYLGKFFEAFLYYSYNKYGCLKVLTDYITSPPNISCLRKMLDFVKSILNFSHIKDENSELEKVDEDQADAFTRIILALKNESKVDLESKGVYIFTIKSKIFKKALLKNYFGRNNIIYLINNTYRYSKEDLTEFLNNEEIYDKLDEKNKDFLYMISFQ